MAAAKEAVAELLTRSHRPTAIICGNDVLAWGAMHALARAGVRVPEDVTVTGIGDFSGSREFEPPLTTVRIPARQIGKRAARSIATAIVSPDEATGSVLIPPELMVRATSGLPRG